MAPPAKKRRKESTLDISAKYGHSNPSKNFLSKDTLKYILENASRIAYYKLIQVSKYFLINQPPQIKTIESLYYSGNWNPSNPDPYKISEITGNRLWITSRDVMWRCSKVPVKSFLQRCIKIDTKWLELTNQEITCGELRLLMESGNIYYLDFSQSKIVHSNGEEVDIEDILKMAPLLKYLTYSPRESFTFSPEKVAGLPDFYYLESIEFHGIDEDFCCRSFRNFLKKASTLTSARFKFDGVSPRFLREFQMTVLKEVDPTIEVKCFDRAVFFGDYEQAED